MSTALLATLRELVEHELAWEPEVAHGTIGVTTDDGVVTLTGFVTSYAEKIAAERSALRVRGVRAVANDLEVRPRGDDSDRDIAKDALAALRANFSIPPSVKVSVTNHLITLEGEVEWMYQKTAAEHAVRYLRAVAGVTNLIVVKPRVAPDAVKSRIEEALRRSAETDARRIHVSAEGSTITLAGTVRSFAEKADAERAAWAAPGVAEVKNLISVET